MNERPECPTSSEMPRLAQCAASHNMGILAAEMGRPKEEPGADAQFGLNVHDALASDTSRRLSTDEERLAYSVMRRLRASAIESWCRASGAHELFEHRMYMHNGAVPVFSGQADYILLEPGRALILDYKSLWNEVAQPRDNHQLKSLAVLLWLSEPGLKEITIQIIAAHHDYEPHTMQVHELRSYLDFLREMLTLAGQANTPVPGDWCRHCRGFLICPAVRKTPGDMVKADAEGLYPSRLPKGDAAAKILDDITIASALIERIRDHYKTVLAEDPKAIPGWVLAPRITRRFKDLGHVFRALEEKHGPDVWQKGGIDISVAKAFENLETFEQSALEDYIERTECMILKKKSDGNKRK